MRKRNFLTLQDMRCLLSMTDEQLMLLMNENHFPSAAIWKDHMRWRWDEVEAYLKKTEDKRLKPVVNKEALEKANEKIDVFNSHYQDLGAFFDRYWEHKPGTHVALEQVSILLYQTVWTVALIRKYIVWHFDNTPLIKTKRDRRYGTVLCNVAWNENTDFFKRNNWVQNLKTIS